MPHTLTTRLEGLRGPAAAGPLTGPGSQHAGDPCDFPVAKFRVQLEGATAYRVRATDGVLQIRRVTEEDAAGAGPRRMYPNVLHPVLGQTHGPQRVQRGALKSLRCHEGFGQYELDEMHTANYADVQSADGGTSRGTSVPWHKRVRGWWSTYGKGTWQCWGRWDLMTTRKRYTGSSWKILPWGSITWVKS